MEEMRESLKIIEQVSDVLEHRHPNLRIRSNFLMLTTYLDLFDAWLIYGAIL